MSGLISQAVGANPASPNAGNIKIIPDSASTCGGAVCIFVTGSGLQVTDWSTSANLSRTMCTTASFLVNGVLYASGVRTCGSSGDELISDLSGTRYFANGTQLCNTWTNISGEACATVHS
jgi:hypothetical protein